MNTFFWFGGAVLLVVYEGVHTLLSHHHHHPMLSKMSFKSVSLRKRRHRSSPATSDDQPPTRKYYLGSPIISFADRSWSDTTAVVSDPASHIDTHDDMTMGTLQTSLAVLVAGSSLASKLPFIAPIAGLLLQALTMRDVRVIYITSDHVLMSASLGSEAIQRGVRNSDAQTRQNREDHCQFV